MLPGEPQLATGEVLVHVRDAPGLPSFGNLASRIERGSGLPPAVVPPASEEFAPCIGGNPR